jgi:hypothetical protein
MNMFEFLKDLGNAEVTSGKEERKSTKQELNPTNGADIRLFKDGRIFPSAELVEEFDLEYTDKDASTGNGFDVIDTRQWAGWKAEVKILLIAAVNKSKAKVDMFSATNYNEDGTAVSSVLTQGATTFGKKLITMLQEVYTEELFGEKNHVDLTIARGYDMSTEDGIYYIPKAMIKGEKKGTAKVVRREYSNLYPLVIFEAKSNEVTNEEGEYITAEITEEEDSLNTFEVFTATSNEELVD